MKKRLCILLVLLMLMSAGCTDQQTDHTEEPTVSETTEAPTQVTETKAVTESVPTDATEEVVDAASGATPTESGKCRNCGAPEDDYDGYCYYCHPDHGFICSNCGFYWPEARPDSGLCPDCEAADAITGATPTVPDGMCKVCSMDRGDYDGYCYYCHPDFGFTCAKCGYEQPYHRPESGLCYECEAGK